MGCWADDGGEGAAAAAHCCAPPTTAPSSLPLGCPNGVLDVAAVGRGDQ